MRGEKLLFCPQITLMTQILMDVLYAAAAIVHDVHILLHRSKLRI